MCNVESLLAHRIRKSSALIALVAPLVRKALAAAQSKTIENPLVVLADTMIWRSKLIVALTELNQSSLRIAQGDHDAALAEDQRLLSALQAEMAGLIDSIAELTQCLLPEPGSR
jgi:hypothetical protein